MLSRLWTWLKAFLTADWVAVGRDLVTFSGYTISRFGKDRCFQAASALTYTSLLSLVPLTTITVAIISAFPAFQDLQIGFREAIIENLVPQVGEAVLDNLQAFVANTGRLTGFGIIGLIVTALLLLATIEEAFNNIWRVRESRSLLIRLLTFWAILTVAPILTVVSLSFTTEVFRSASLGTGTVRPLARLMPPLLEFFILLALYWLIPNRVVRVADAAIGAAVATVLFEIAKAGFALYINTALYVTIYGAIATIPIFLLWLYIAWSVVLLGAVIAAGLPDWRAGKLLGVEADQLPQAQRLILACAILRVLVDASRLGTRIRRKTMLRRVPIGGTVLDGILDQLRHARFVERGEDDGWILSRDVDRATLYDLAKSFGVGLRGYTSPIDALKGDQWEEVLRGLLTEVDAAQQRIMCIPLIQVLEPQLPAGPVKLHHDPGRIG